MMSFYDVVEITWRLVSTIKFLITTFVNQNTFGNKIKIQWNSKFLLETVISNILLLSLFN